MLKVVEFGVEVVDVPLEIVQLREEAFLDGLDLAVEGFLSDADVLLVDLFDFDEAEPFFL